MKIKSIYLILFLINCVFYVCALNLESAESSQDVNDSAEDVNEISEPDSGNWYEKLQIWKKAKPKYDEVKQLKEKVTELNNQLLSKQVDYSKKLEEFYKNLRVNKDLVINQIDNLISNIKVDENIDPDNLSENEKKEFDQKIKDKKDLENLKSDFNFLFLFKSRLDTAVIDLANGQVQLADSYEEKSLDSFEKIENILDDQKAKLLYQTIENSVENINSIIDYLNGPLMNSVNESIAKIIDSQSKIQSNINSLLDRAIFVPQLSDQEKNEILDRIKKAQEKDMPKCKEPEKKENLSWWQKLIDFIKALLNYIWQIIKAPFAYIYSFFSTDIKNKPISVAKEAPKFDNKS